MFIEHKLPLELVLTTEDDTFVTINHFISTIDLQTHTLHIKTTEGDCSRRKVCGEMEGVSERNGRHSIRSDWAYITCTNTKAHLTYARMMNFCVTDWIVQKTGVKALMCRRVASERRVDGRCRKNAYSVCAFSLTPHFSNASLRG